MSVRVPLSCHSGPRIPGLNEKGFGEPGLDSPQLTSCLRIKWYIGDAPDNIKKMTSKDIEECQKINKVNSERKKQD